MSLQQIADFLNENTSLDAINDIILDAENVGKNRIEKVKAFAEQHGVVVSVQDASTIAYAVQDVTGIYIHPTYQESFKSYTARFSSWGMLWQTVRGNIHDFYTLINGELNGEKGTFRCKNLSLHQVPTGTLEVVKQFKNGYTIYKVDRKFVEYLSLIYSVRDYFSIRTNVY